VILGEPYLSGDSLVGSVKDTITGIPLDKVGKVAVRRGDALKTAGLIGLIIGGGVAIFVATFTIPPFDLPLCLMGPCEEEEYAR
jgi:hypothetical protein